MSSSYQSIYLDADKCIGCTACTKRCPTEAIRVRGGKAVILQERCVDCGECIRVCPQHAMKARVDSLDEVLGRYRHTVALPASALYGQFPGITSRAPILKGLTKIGFDSVFEVSAAAEVIAAAARHELRFGDIPHPILTTSCPVILRIVRMRFPSLMPHLFSYRSPMDFAARWSKRLVSKKTGIPAEDIGCVYISPCPAKCASAKVAFCTAHPQLNGIVSISQVAPRLNAVMGEIEDREEYSLSGALGVGCAMSGGLAVAAGEPNHLAASGLENVIGILEALEDGKLADVDLIELSACYPGCVGGPLTVENPFIAKARIRQIMNRIGPTVPADECPLDDLRWERAPQPSTALRLHEDVSAAMDMMERIQRITQTLPGINCAACGAPSCHAYAEDIVTGRAKEGECILLRRTNAPPAETVQQK